MNTPPIIFFFLIILIHNLFNLYILWITVTSGSELVNYGASLRKTHCVIWLVHSQEVREESGGAAQRQPCKEMGCGLRFDRHYSAAEALWL